MSSPVLAPEALAELAGAPVRSLSPLGGGRNSRVFRLDTEDGRSCALKVYFRHPGDDRDRLGVEFGALDYLWTHGLRCIPQPLARAPEAALGLYGFVTGDRVGRPTAAEVDQACAFLARLRTLAAAPETRELPEASEACFSFQAIVASVQVRIDRLAGLEPEAARASGLAPFLEDSLVPAWGRLLASTREACDLAGLGFEAPLAPADRTLSPSDFGFHNALRGPEGLVFLDFEYFGWDDPAKMVADFLLHPGMDLTPELRRRFAGTILDKLALEGLPLRTRLVYPLFGIKWCLILLNEFLAGPLHRRAFADLNARSAGDRQARQLEKARLKLQQLLDDHAHFPHFSL